MPLKKLCVFCGANSGARVSYAHAAVELAQHLIKENITLVYGGGKVGLMGTVANAMMEAGGEVIGVIPKALVDKEVAHHGLTHLEVVESMHQRKSRMAEMSDGFIAMPGGFGTFEEIFEVVTWSQLGLHKKPCGFLNVDGFYDSMMAMMDHAINEKFIRTENSSLLIIRNTPKDLIEAFKIWQPPIVEKWISKSET